MSKIIIFNTLAQANNFAKKQFSHYHYEGCGCCWDATGTIVDTDTNLVIRKNRGEARGHVYYHCEVIGRIKKKKGVSV